MLFHHNFFSPQLLPDQRARDVLISASEQATGLLRPSDVLASAIRLGDERLHATLSRALRQGFSLDDIINAVSDGLPAGVAGSGAKRRRESFTPQALLALGSFEVALQATGNMLNGAALEVLLHFCLANLDDQERRDLVPLDTDLAASLLNDQAAKAAVINIVQEVLEQPEKVSQTEQAESKEQQDEGGGREIDAQERLFLLPPELAPSEDLTDRVRTSEMPEELPFDGEPMYDRLFDGLARALHRRGANHVLLTGERGVSKNSIVAELARRAATGRIPFLKGRRFLSVDCRHFPPDESRHRLVALLNHVAGKAGLVVCLDGFPALLRGERGTNNKPVLLSALARASCQFIGLLTPRDYEELISDDPDFVDFFTRIDVEEPDPEVAMKLLCHFSSGLTQRFRVAIDEDAVRQAVVLSANYILNDQLPAKALKILQHVCEEIDYERNQQASPRDRVTAEDVVRAVAQISGVPQETLRGIAERSDYEQSLREVIFGQDHAVREVALELGLIKAGLTDPNKPASVMLFLGPTGTGKTEMGKVLARFYSTSKRLKSITLGNCVESHSVSTIIGVPPGYVGHDQGGRLVNDLNADPYCVFLLDEADKAHPDVLQPFLNLFDEGWVCDQRGVKAYANKSIFILTSNVGQRMIADMVAEGKGHDEIRDRMKEVLAQIKHTKAERPVFSPEFLARIKRIIVFNPLGREAMHGIARKLVEEMQQSWREKRGKRLEIPVAFVDYLTEQSHLMNEKSKGKEGGRIVRKLLSDWVDALLQREISLRPGEYKGCAGIEVVFTPPEAPPPEGTTPQPTLSLRFIPVEMSGRSPV
jgi:ATP-dependent Clp protease ATP-binding subunit ClpA